MEEYNQDTLPQDFTRLPQNVRNFIADGIWRDRTEEIGRKYALSTSQIDQLTTEVLLLLMGLINPDTILETLTVELGISDLLASQLINDLDTRVFDYALKTIEKGGEEKIPTPRPLQQQNTPFVPENLPGAIEVEEKPVPTKYTETPAPIKQVVDPVPTPVVQQPTAPWMKQAPVVPETATSTPIEPQPLAEPSKIVWPTQPTEIQIPTVSVPRFTAVPLDEKTIEPTPSQKPVLETPAPQNIIEAKLSGVVKPKIEIPTGITEKYTTDPYREPIE